MTRGCMTLSSFLSLLRFSFHVVYNRGSRWNRLDIFRSTSSPLTITRCKPSMALLDGGHCTGLGYSHLDARFGGSCHRSTGPVYSPHLHVRFGDDCQTTAQSFLLFNSDHGWLAGGWLAVNMHKHDPWMHQCHSFLESLITRS